MSSGERWRGFLGLLIKTLGVLLAILGGLVVYYAYNIPISLIDPKAIASLGIFLIAVGGLMLLARVR